MQQSGGYRNVAPTAILAQALSKVVDEPAQQQLRAFVPATGFQGQKPGYFFSRGPAGLGYYLDRTQLAPGQGAEGENGQPTGSEGAEAEEGGPSGSRPPPKALDPEELLREAEEAAGEGGLQFVDAKGLKRLVLALERKYNANMELRMKYADQPDKFLDSELDLDEAVKNCMAIASSPELYPDLARTSAIPTLLALLNHENSDIAADVMELLQELTDGDVIEDSEEEAAVLVDTLLENNLLELLVHRMTSFNESIPEEASAVFAALGTIENLVEVKPQVADQVTEKTKVLKWLLQRLRRKEVDSNKQYASEVLAILVQSSDANKKKLAAMNGIDALLQGIAPYRNRDPSTAEEEELLENLFDATCSCLMLPDNKTLFVQAEGVELMLLILKSKRAARTSALKCLDFATTGCPPACDRLVDQQGLKTLFAVFMGKLKVKRRDDSALQEEEERTVSIIANLLQGISKASRRDRVAAKFVENECEKCDRLMELLFRYQGRVRAEERRLASLEDEEELGEVEVLLARMDAGLYTLQQCALVVGHLWMAGDAGVRKRVLVLLHQKSCTLATLREVLLEYRASLGDDGDGEASAKLSQQVTQMLLALGHDPAEDEAAAAAAAEAAAKRRQAEAAQAQEEREGAADVKTEPEGAEGGARKGSNAAGAAKMGDAEDADMELEDAEVAAAGARRGKAEEEEEERDRDAGREKQRERERREGRGRDEDDLDRGERRERERGGDRLKDRERGGERERGRDRERERERSDRREREREHREREKRRREEEDDRRVSDRKRDRRDDDRRDRRDDDRRRSRREGDERRAR